MPSTYKLRPVDPKSEYTVEFECYSKILVAFEDVAGLSQNQIVQKAAGIANHSFETEGILTTERNAKDHSYSITVLGVDSGTANILSHPSTDKPKLRLRLIRSGS